MNWRYINSLWNTINCKSFLWRFHACFSNRIPPERCIYIYIYIIVLCILRYYWQGHSKLHKHLRKRTASGSWFQTFSLDVLTNLCFANRQILVTSRLEYDATLPHAKSLAPKRRMNSSVFSCVAFHDLIKLDMHFLARFHVVFPFCFHLPRTLFAIFFPINWEGGLFLAVINACASRQPCT